MHFFPKPTDRSIFVRQAANLCQVKAALQKRYGYLSGQANDPVQVIDTLPLPVCVITRAGPDRCFAQEADFGYCLVKGLHYDGFKLGLRISRLGMITQYPLLAARPHGINSLDALLEGFEGLVPADKSFIDAYRQALFAERHGITVVTPAHKNRPTDLPRALLKFCKYVRKFVETVASPLTERFEVNKIRVHDLLHSQHRLIRKIFAQTVCVFLNLTFGRPPLDLDGLVSA